MSQSRRALLSSIIALPALASRANGNPRLERLYGMFIAPCCWRENLLVHSSPKADEMRAEIQSLIASGRTDEEIKAAFLNQYSLRILALPEGVRGQWLSWTPWALAASGALAVAYTIHRSTKHQQPQPVPASSIPLPDSEWD